MVTDYEAMMRQELRVITNLKGNLGKLPSAGARLRVLRYLTSIVENEAEQVAMDLEGDE